MAAEKNKDNLIRRRVLIGTTSNYIGQFISFSTFFFLTPFLLRHLGAANYGLWVLIGSVVAYGSLLDIGIWGALIKYVAEYRARGENEQARRLLATALRLYVFLGLAIIALIGAAAPVFPAFFNIPADQQGTATRLIVLMGLGVGMSLPGMAPMAVLRGLHRYDAVTLVDVVALIFTAAASVGVLLLGGDVLGLAIVNICSLFIVTVLSAILVHRIAPELRFSWRGADPQLTRVVLSYSWPLFVKDVAFRLQTKTDEITIGVFLPVQSIAPYNVGKKLAETTQILTKQFMKVLLPLASELHAENDLARLRSLFVAGTRLTLAISLAISCLLIFLARPLLTVWVGAEYASASSLVAILALASFAATTLWPAAAVLQGMARHRVLAATSLGSGLANLALSVALIRPLGLTGVALGTLIPNVLEFFIVLPYTLKVVGVSAAEAIKDIFLPVLSPAVLMALTLYTLQQIAEPSSLLAIMIVAGIGLLVYGIGYLIIGASRSEKQTYRGIAFSVFRFARAQLKRLG